MLEIRSKKKPDQPVKVGNTETSEPPVQEYSGEQNLMEVLTTLREIHEGSCMVNLLVTENEIQIQSTQRVILTGEQK